MIVVRIIGGLGNQMFQYATGRNLSIRNSTKLILDTQPLEDANRENFTIRNFELGIFNLDDKVKKNPFLNLLNSSDKIFSSVYYRVKRKLIRFNSYFEKNLKYDIEIQGLGRNVYLDGYFQSENYFKESRKILLNDFEFQIELNIENKNILNLIKKSNAVSIHIRRGDYVNNKQINSVHGVLQKPYYDNAIDYIINKEKAPYFFIFSDDPQWVKDNYKLNFPFVVISNNIGDQSYIDMYLMSCCSHNIIANSSFSWWGAWLNTNPNKIVIGPKKWFNDAMKKNSIMCPDWIEME